MAAKKKRTKVYLWSHEDRFDRPAPGTRYGCFTLGRLLGTGSTRFTYECKEFPTLVIKVPRDLGCSWANRSEADKFAKDGDKRLARCSLLDNGWLVMERVKVMSDPNSGAGLKCPVNGFKAKDIPRWAYAIDCCQVGKTRRGVVAFDYA